LIPLLERLPDHGLLASAVTVALVVGAGAYFHLVSGAFPFWRSLLAGADRRRLWAGSAIGGILGGSLGTIPAFLVLPPESMALTRSPRSMAVLLTCAVVAGVAGAFREAGPLPLFAPAIPHDPAGTLASTA
jgi:hypothetical protein